MAHHAGRAAPDPARWDDACCGRPERLARMVDTPRGGWSALGHRSGAAEERIIDQARMNINRLMVSDTLQRSIAGAQHFSIPNRDGAVGNLATVEADPAKHVHDFGTLGP